MERGERNGLGETVEAEYESVLGVGSGSFCCWKKERPRTFQGPHFFPEPTAAIVSFPAENNDRKNLTDHRKKMFPVGLPVLKKCLV